MSPIPTFIFLFPPSRPTSPPNLYQIVVADFLDITPQVVRGNKTSSNYGDLKESEMVRGSF